MDIERGNLTVIQDLNGLPRNIFALAEDNQDETAIEDSGCHDLDSISQWQRRRAPPGEYSDAQDY